MKKHYITYEGKRNNVVWGTGKTAEKSKRDAKASIREYNTYSPDKIETELDTVICSEELYDYVNTVGGHNVRWEMKKGVAERKKYTI
jgi:hypothetical protein